MREINNIEKKTWIDVLKGIGALMVIVAHSPKPIIVSMIIVPSFLAIFFFSSGYTYKYKKSYISKLLKNTIVLMVELSFFDIIVRKFVNKFFFGAEQTNIVNDYLGLILNKSGNAKYPDYLWFFACMFMGKAIFHIYHMIKNEKICFIISMVMSMCGTFLWLIPGEVHDIFWHIPIALLMQVIMELGYLCKKYDGNKSIDVILAIMAPVLLLVLLYTIMKYPIDADLHTGMFSNYKIYCLQVFCELTIIIYFARKISSNRFLEYMGRHSAFFYGYQMVYIFIYSYLANIYMTDSNSLFIQMLFVVPMVCFSIYLTIEARNIMGLLIKDKTPN